MYDASSEAKTGGPPDSPKVALEEALRIGRMFSSSNAFATQNEPKTSTEGPVSDRMPLEGDMTELERGLGSQWFEEVWNKGRREAIAELLAPDAVFHEGKTDCVGPEGFYEFFDRLNAAFSEFCVTVHD